MALGKPLPLSKVEPQRPSQRPLYSLAIHSLNPEAHKRVSHEADEDPWTRTATFLLAPGPQGTCWDQPSHCLRGRILY